MIVKNKGYAAYLVGVKGKGYRIDENMDLVFDMELSEHDDLFKEYKGSVHRKIHKLTMKFHSLGKGRQV